MSLEHRQWEECHMDRQRSEGYTEARGQSQGHRRLLLSPGSPPCLYPAHTSPGSSVGGSAAPGLGEGDPSTLPSRSPMSAPKLLVLGAWTPSLQSWTCCFPLPGAHDRDIPVLSCPVLSRASPAVPSEVRWEVVKSRLWVQSKDISPEQGRHSLRRRQALLHPSKRGEVSVGMRSAGPTLDKATQLGRSSLNPEQWTPARNKSKNHPEASRAQESRRWQKEKPSPVTSVCGPRRDARSEAGAQPMGLPEGKTGAQGLQTHTGQ